MEGAKNYWWFGAGPVCSEISRDFWGIPLVSKITWWKLKDQKFLNLILLHCWKKHLGHFPVTLSSSRLLLFGFLFLGGHQSLGANTASAVSKSCWIHQWYDTTFYPKLKIKEVTIFKWMQCFLLVKQHGNGIKSGFHLLWK